MEPNPNKNHSLILEKNDSMDFKKNLLLIARAWPWFVLTIFICLCISFFYLRYTVPIFNVSSRILVNDDKKGVSSGNSEALGELSGLFGEKSSIDNVVEVFGTRDLLKKVVIDMKLNIRYYRVGRFNEIELYKTPFVIEILQESDTVKFTEFEVKLLSSKRIQIQGDGIDKTINYDRPIKINGIGVIQFHNNGITSGETLTYKVSIQSVDAAISLLKKNLTVATTNKQVSIIDLNLNTTIPKKGEDVLNKLIEKYAQSNLEDKNLIADSTIKFIQNRLSIIGYELGDLEGDIQGFKERNSLTDMTEQGKALINNTSRLVQELANAETQINILKSLQDYLKDGSQNKRVLPNSILPSDQVFNGLIERYNQLLIERDHRLLSVTETNPFVVNLDEQINTLRVDILSNIDNTRRTLNITKKGIESQINNVQSNMQGIPKIERNYLDLARQQQIKQQLYLFLMQKSEESAISKTANISNSKVIDSPRANTVPVSPNRIIVLLIGFISGLVIPLVVIYSKNILNTKIESKEDILSRTDVPIIGEISHNEISNDLISIDSRSAISEQFRALRTNLSFYLEDSTKKVILLTSSMSGEGKSFVAINLGNILALTNKKVVLVEFDLRKPGISGKIGVPNSIGFTNYIITTDLELHQLIKPTNLHKDLMIINSGPIPPNPAEMLMNERTKALIEELKLQFDYIIIDAPPIGIVADAQLLSSHADATIYLVRQNYTFKEQLNIVQDLHKNGKMKNLAIVVNDIKHTDGYGYGYGYSYGYGYGAGYGVYGNDLVKKSFWQKIFQKNN